MLGLRKPGDVRGENYRSRPGGLRLVEHKGFKCCGCGLDPIKGKRLRCLKCRVTFCEFCKPERFNHGHHPFETLTEAVVNPLETILNSLKAEPHPMEAIFNYCELNPGGEEGNALGKFFYNKISES